MLSSAVSYWWYNPVRVDYYWEMITAAEIVVNLPWNLRTAKDQKCWGHRHPQAGATGCTCTPLDSDLIFFATLYMLLQHINSLTDIFKEHRNHAEEHFRDDILSKARPLADKLGIDLILPRICSRQTHRVNTAGLDFESYYRTCLYSVSWFVSVVIDVSLFQQ